ncbi:uncharacterized membrane-anchored protein YjiN (DUF445 family) [Humitalea rosea]|uniref:Uncharacterized membrane-anchored protein YjiN (DUF445 family) n=1 Tax=Humitalea rosea TaxID=990373 RepID=A0A2W7HZR7_9PROT|nr:DUF445 domain-containing protein [Humitalea rosea]PZW40036.1 uncharacterized membrane-anchored protein YjiN (DUF445 family) [Humitalea rosea]
MQGSPLPDPDAALRRGLSRHRRFATGLLLAMGAAMLGAYALPSGYWADLAQAATKAGLVGGLADWFAVTALFRRPLGLPIPHTAIIPTQKARLGKGLGRFVANHVFVESEVRGILARLDPAAILQRFLADPETSRQTARALSGMLPRILQTISDGRARRFLTRLLPRMVTGPAAARLVARVLRALISGGRHQEVFGLAVAQLKALLVAREDALREAIAGRVRAEGGAVVGWLAGATVARRILAALNAELDKVEPEDSELRAAFAEWVAREIDRLESDPERAAALARVMRDALAHPSVETWLMDVWDRLRAGLATDAARPDGRTVSLLAGVMANAGTLLSEDPAARERFNLAVERVLVALLPSAQTRLADFIGGVVEGWDTETVTDKIELRVGRDLQYVRINGTLVGFLAGGVLYAALTAAFGYVAH